MQSSDIFQNIDNPWYKAYWFSRMLVNDDKYVSLAKEKKLLSTIATSLRLVFNTTTNGDDILLLQKTTLKNLLERRFEKAKAKEKRIQTLLFELDEMITSGEDMNIFILTCEYIMLPLNDAIANIPSNDKEFTEVLSKSFLELQGEYGLANVIKYWDDLGVKGCLTAERTEIVRAFTALRTLLSSDDNINEREQDIILTGFTQEFERRAGQKRKKRAGGSLEDVTSFILKYYSIKTTDTPEHFKADIEVDKWLKTKDGWLIGISCKRTLRERWKQVSSASAEVLSTFKIKYIYNVVTYDEDLSDDKLASLGAQRHVFYLPDNSRKLELATNNVGLKNYVRPISQLINDLKNEMN